MNVRIACARTAGALAVLAATLLISPSAWAFEAKDNDAFFIALGSSNIQVKDSDDLLDGSNVVGGIRIGLFWTVFLELGYGTMYYEDTVKVDGLKKKIEFRTTGANAALGFLIPIRKMAIGAKFVTNPDNKWEETQTDDLTGTKDFSESGTIHFDSYSVFAMIGPWFEVGARRDVVNSSDSVVTNSFGPYIAFAKHFK